MTMYYLTTQPITLIENWDKYNIIINAINCEIPKPYKIQNYRLNIKKRNLKEKQSGKGTKWCVL